MARAEDVAKFIIDIFSTKAEIGLDDGMTNLRLQKLMFLAQGYYLAKYGTPLFNEPIEAWRYGPVVPSIYEKYSKFKDNAILDSAPEENALTTQEAELVIDVLSEFGKYSAGYLVEMSHAPGAPWDQVYQESKKNAISTDKIKEYYRKQKPLNSIDNIIERLAKNSKEPRRGPDGYVLLPAEDYEDWEEYAHV